eukprot:PhF_6_TR34639/c0_g1_i1/m.50409
MKITFFTSIAPKETIEIANNIQLSERTVAMSFRMLIANGEVGGKGNATLRVNGVKVGATIASGSCHVFGSSGGDCAWSLPDDGVMTLENAGNVELIVHGIQEMVFKPEVVKALLASES